MSGIKIVYFSPHKSQEAILAIMEGILAWVAFETMWINAFGDGHCSRGLKVAIFQKRELILVRFLCLLVLEGSLCCSMTVEMAASLNSLQSTMNSQPYGRVLPSSNTSTLTTLSFLCGWLYRPARR